MIIKERTFFERRIVSRRLISEDDCYLLQSICEDYKKMGHILEDYTAREGLT